MTRHAHPASWFYGFLTGALLAFACTFAWAQGEIERRAENTAEIDLGTAQNPTFRDCPPASAPRHCWQAHE